MRHLRSLPSWSSLPKEAAGESGDECHFDEQPDKGFKGGQDGKRVIQFDATGENDLLS